ncbi:MAG: hypothetical protein JWR89_1134 [Tardiphaga sp.]|nr:hypothetical protein [Tardiphaga sp.]
MRKHGFGTVNLSQGGPERDSAGRPRATDADKARAIQLNSDWDAARLGLPPQRPAGASVKYPPGSVGDGFYRAMAIRRAARAQAGIIWSVEQTKRDSWPRAWRFLESEFGDCDPNTIEPEHFIAIDEKTGKTSGLIPRIEQEVSVTERHLVIKIWRALWQRMASMKYCDGNMDPSKAFENKAPDPRQATWMRREVLKLVQVAWRNNYRGLAVCMAVAWDSMLSPIDARSLTLEQLRVDTGGLMFALERAKTNKAAAATLSPWSEALLRAYINGFGAEFLRNVPIFRTTPTLTVPGRGGRPRPSVPYTKDRLVKDFDKVRELAFGPDETRKFSDMRRSGAVEGDAGGGSVTDQSNKMANTVSANTRLRKTYNPVNVASVRRFDEARVIGSRNLEQNLTESISVDAVEILLGKTKNAEPLK